MGVDEADVDPAAAPAVVELANLLVVDDIRPSDQRWLLATPPTAAFGGTQ